MVGYIYKSSKHRRSGTTMQKSKSRADQARYDAVREVLPGFPRGAFERREDVEAYISGDRITCLLCGKDYKKLMVHVSVAHQMGEREYRLKFNISSRYSLAGVLTREKHRAAGLQRKEEGHTAKMIEMSPANKAGHKYRPQKVQMTLSEGAERLRAVNRSGAPRSLRRSEDYSWHLEVMRTTYNFTQVPVPEGLASWGTLRARRRHDPVLSELCRAAAAQRPTK